MSGIYWFSTGEGAATSRAREDDMDKGRRRIAEFEQVGMRLCALRQIVKSCHQALCVIFSSYSGHMLRTRRRYILLMVPIAVPARVADDRGNAFLTPSEILPKMNMYICYITKAVHLTNNV